MSIHGCPGHDGINRRLAARAPTAVTRAVANIPATQPWASFPHSRPKTCVERSRQPPLSRSSAWMWTGLRTTRIPIPKPLGSPTPALTRNRMLPLPHDPGLVVMHGGQAYWADMTTDDVQISPVSVLAGIGSLERRSLCTLIATLEKADMVSVAAEAIRLSAGKLGVEIKQMAEAASEAAEALFLSDQRDHALRHRLWRRINDSLNIGNHQELRGQATIRSIA